MSGSLHNLFLVVKGKIVAFNWSLQNMVFSRFRRRELKNSTFSIICNNCVGGLLYQWFGLPYSTPTVGLFFFADDYIKFLEGFHFYIEQPLRFVKNSRHPEVKAPIKRSYPIGVLGDDIEIHFMHYRTENEALEKWNRRKSRINRDNLFFMYSDRDNFKDEYLEKYVNLPYERKVFFSSKPRGHGEIVVYVEDYMGKSQVGESEHNLKYAKYFDIVRWLNGESGFMKGN